PSGGFEWLRSTNTSGQLNASTAAGTTGYPSWVRIERDGDDYTASWSRDGVTFTQVGAPVQLPGAASVQDIGLFVTAHHATARSEVVFSDFVFDDDPGSEEPEEPEEPSAGPTCQTTMSDEFTGAELDASRWTTVRNAEGSPVTVSDGVLRLPVTGADIDGANTGPISYVGQPVPSGQWQVDTMVTAQYSRHWQHTGLLVHSTDNDYVKLAYTRHENGSRFIEFWSELGGSRTQHANNVTLATSAPNSVHLRLI